ncbi:MAG: hypothetical protein FWG10_02110 [Eubacteriaceae bacterium]|nr:hypothetical protein [Eubacteriaceae bacterium]
MRFLAANKFLSTETSHPARLAAQALLVLFVLSFLLSTVFILFSSSHEHDLASHNGECALCAFISFLEDLFKYMPGELLAVAIALASCFCAIASLASTNTCFVFSTPIALRDRINN